LFEENNISPIIEESEKKPVVVLFSAEWLGSAHILETFLNEIAEEVPNLALYKIDVDQNQALTEQFGISQVPTTVFLRNGEIKDFLLGIMSKRRLKEHLDNFLGE
jgi:thioredoxin 1